MPSFTLFPYTTLFRSFGRCLSLCSGRGDDGSCPLQVSPVRRRRQDLCKRGNGTGCARSTFCNRRHRTRTCCEFHQDEANRDRKSTRLNSSHVEISYAVIYTLSLHDALPIFWPMPFSMLWTR